MTTQELKQYIDKVLGSSIRCLLPSYWWKRIFGLVVDEVEKVSVSAKNANTKISNISLSLDSEKTSTVRIYDNNPEANKKALKKIIEWYYSNPVRVVYGNRVSTYCNHYRSNDELFCYIIFDDKSGLINDSKQETTYVIRLYEDGTIEKKTHYSQMIRSVDGTLSQFSTNPIQNQVVSVALLSKADEVVVEQEFKDRETIAIYVPAEGQTLPRLLSDQNGKALSYKWNSIYGHKEQSWDSIRDDYDKVNKRGVVYVYHGVAYQGNSELDVQYILTQHTALTIEAIDNEVVDGWHQDRIYMRFYDSDNRLCIAKIGGKAEIEVVDIPVDTTNFVEKTEIKTINGQSIIGEGDITIEAGNNITVDTSLSSSSTNPVQNKVVTAELAKKKTIIVEYDKYIDIKRFLDTLNVEPQISGNYVPPSYRLETKVLYEEEFEDIFGNWLKNLGEEFYTSEVILDDSTTTSITVVKPWFFLNKDNYGVTFDYSYSRVIEGVEYDIAEIAIGLYNDTSIEYSVYINLKNAYSKTRIINLSDVPEKYAKYKKQLESDIKDYGFECQYYGIINNDSITTMIPLSITYDKNYGAPYIYISGSYFFRDSVSTLKKYNIIYRINAADVVFNDNFFNDLSYIDEVVENTAYKTYVDESIATAITNTLNTEV